MNRRESFEAAYAAAHDLPIETFSQYRMGDTYRLPLIAKCWRFWNLALDSVVVKLPAYQEGCNSPDFDAGWNKCLDWSRESNEGFTVEVHKS